jgi:hypothetical protein
MTTFSTLFGKRLFGAHLFNGDLATTSYSDDTFVFDGFSLQRDDGAVVMESYNDPMPTRELIGGGVPRGHGMYLNGAFWRKSPITVKGKLLYSSVATMLAGRDLMKAGLAGTEKFLDITEGGRVRRYIATLDNPQSLFPAREHYHNDWLPFQASFECRTPFALDRAYTTTEGVMTTTPTSFGANPTGTIESEAVVVLIVGSAANCTTINIKRIDPADGSTKEEIEYTGSVSAGDVFIFDGELKKVLKNSAEVAYTGGHLTLPIMSNLIKVTISGSTPTFSIGVTVKWKNRYL